MQFFKKVEVLARNHFLSSQIYNQVSSDNQSKQRYHRQKETCHLIFSKMNQLLHYVSLRLQGQPKVIDKPHD